MTKGDITGSCCPACLDDSGVDAEAWFRDHDRAKSAVCLNCGAKLRAYYDECGEEGGFWAFEETEGS